MEIQPEQVQFLKKTTASVPKDREVAHQSQTSEAALTFIYLSVKI